MASLVNRQLSLVSITDWWYYCWSPAEVRSEKLARLSDAGVPLNRQRQWYTGIHYTYLRDAYRAPFWVTQYDTNYKCRINSWRYQISGCACVTIVLLWVQSGHENKSFTWYSLPDSKDRWYIVMLHWGLQIECFFLNTKRSGIRPN